MKRLPIYLLVALLAFGCKSKKSKDEVVLTSPDGKQKVSVDVNQAGNTAADMQKQAEELQKLPVMSLDELKALMPAELMGAKQSNYSATSMAGASFAKADFKTNDTTKVSVMYYDCAGAAGSGIYSAQYLAMMNFQQEDDNGYTKSIDYMGQRAVEHCEKRRNECTLMYFTGGRFLVTLEGENVDVGTLKQVGESLHLK